MRGNQVIIILIIPIVTAIVCYVLKSPRLIGYVSLAGIVALAVSAAPDHCGVPVRAGYRGMSGAFSMDALSGYIMGLVLFCKPGLGRLLHQLP